MSRISNTESPSPVGEGRGGVLLSPAYLPPISWFARLIAGDAMIEVCDHYVKQTYRNRCHIATPQGVQALIVPAATHLDTSPQRGENGGRAVFISDQASWRHTHWQALVSAYRMSPFFDYYADDLYPYYDKPRTETLYDYDLELVRTICRLMHIDPPIRLTDHYRTAAQCREEGILDLREVIHPKRKTPPQPSPTGEGAYKSLHVGKTRAQRTILNNNPPHPVGRAGAGCYYQVFAPKTGFLPDLSIVDLLFNLGPEAPLYLKTLNSDSDL